MYVMILAVAIKSYKFIATSKKNPKYIKCIAL